MMRNSIFDLENGGSTYTRVNTVPESVILHICSLVSFNLLDKLLLQKSAIEFVMTQDL